MKRWQITLVSSRGPRYQISGRYLTRWAATRTARKLLPHHHNQTTTTPTLTYTITQTTEGTLTP